MSNSIDFYRASEDECKNVPFTLHIRDIVKLIFHSFRIFILYPVAVK